MPDHHRETLRVTREGAVLRVTLSRPEVLNALNALSFRQKARAGEEPEVDVDGKKNDPEDEKHMPDQKHRLRLPDNLYETTW